MAAVARFNQRSIVVRLNQLPVEVFWPNFASKCPGICDLDNLHRVARDDRAVFRAHYRNHVSKEANTNLDRVSLRDGVDDRGLSHADERQVQAFFPLPAFGDCSLEYIE